jgi:UDP-glucose 4-epimerase
LTWIVTGGAGYIGAHVVHLLRARGHSVVVFDNMSTGEPGRVPIGVPVVRGSVTDADALDRLLAAHEVDGVVHHAGRKSTADSVRDPDLYTDANVVGVRRLLTAMDRAGVGRLLFASSAAVYGDSGPEPAAEDRVPRPVSPYGETKRAAERLVAEATGSSLRAIMFRQFNVVGAGVHPLAMDRMRTTLLPAIFAAVGGGPALVVHGLYETPPDHTATRDYVHVADVAEAYARAVDAPTGPGPDHQVVNVGSGRETSVLELVDLVQRVTGRAVPYRVGEARKGDAARSVADVRRAQALGYACDRPLADAIRSAWIAWQAAMPAAAGR